MQTLKTFMKMDYELLDKRISNLIKNLQESETLSIDQNCLNLWQVLEQLTAEQFAQLQNNAFFTELLMLIPVQFHVSQSFQAHDKQEINEYNGLPHMELPLDKVCFDNHFDKLILKFRNSINSYSGEIIFGDRLIDLLSLNQNDLTKLHGIGRKYIHLWDQLRHLYGLEFIPIQNGSSPGSQSEILNNLDVDNMELNLLGLDDIEIKHLEKWKRLGYEPTISEILKFDKKEFASIDGVGKNFLKALAVLKKNLTEELLRIANNEIDYMRWEGQLVRPKHAKNISVEDLGNILLVDIDAFLDRLEEKDIDIFQKRWGFVESQKTLEELGLDLGITRERVRQKERKLNEMLVGSLRISTESIWEILNGEISFQLPRRMKDLFSCFDKEKNFWSFLEHLTGGKNIARQVRPGISPDALNTFFAENGGPLNYADVKKFVEEYALAEGLDINSDNAINYLVELKTIRVDEEKVYPAYLKKNESAAYVLANHPRGLPWYDIAKLVNLGKISKTNLSETRPDSQALFDSDLIYLSGKGVYRHTKFIDFETIDVSLVFDELLSFFVENNRDVVHLNEAYQKFKNIQKCDYYVVRYIVKIYGEDYGFYFDGKSQADSVGLEKNFKNITQKDVIIQSMNNNAKPMTKAEIAKLLKSNSIGHAAFHLEEMMKEEKVVQVDRMLYTTPEIAYKSIDIDQYLDGINEVLFEEGRPVEPSVFQEKLNLKLTAFYSKYFYASIAKNYSKQYGWHRAYTIFSLNEIPYKCLADAIGESCCKESCFEENYRKLSKRIAITKESAKIALHNWLYREN